MEYNTKLPKNNKGYLVGNRCFETLREAEIYCDENDFDPNEMIQHDKYEAHRISNILYDSMDDLSNSILAMFKTVRSEILEISKLKEENEGKCWLQRGYYEGRMRELVGELEGLSKAYKAICNKKMSMLQVKYSYGR